MSTEAIENPASEDRRIYNPIQKDSVTFLKTSEETGAEFTLVEIEVAPGGGNTPHYHKTYDEHFKVLKGTLEVQVSNNTRTLRPGQKALAPRNILHCFRNPTDEPTKFVVELRPASAGFENALKAGYGLARDGLTTDKGIPKNPLYLALLLQWSDMRLPGMFTVAEPLFGLLAKWARRKGIDKELEAKYCR